MGVTQLDAMIIPVLVLAVETIRDAVAEHSEGVPSGVVYAAMNAHGMTLDIYNQIIAVMQEQGLITVSNHLITLGRK